MDENRWKDIASNFADWLTDQKIPFEMVHGGMASYAENMMFNDRGELIPTETWYILASCGLDGSNLMLKYTIKTK